MQILPADKIETAHYYMYIRTLFNCMLPTQISHDNSVFLNRKQANREGAWHKPVKRNFNRAETKSNRAEVKSNRAETDHFSAIKKIVCAIIKNICAMKRIVCAMMCWSKQFNYLFYGEKNLPLRDLQDTQAFSKNENSRHLRGLGNWEDQKTWS